MPLSTDPKAVELASEVLKSFDKVSGGIHPGFRPGHAKGILLTGTFTPAPDARKLTRAPHIQRPSTPVTVRLSDFAGIPNVPDNDPNGASPRGCVIRFNLADHVHTDIVAHSVDSFPARTAEGLIDFLNAVAATDPNGPHPNAIEQYLSTHPEALAFVQIPKPIPTSFAHESFFAVSAFKFTNAEGKSQYGRYHVVPVAGNEYLSSEEAAKQSPNFLFDELKQRLASSPVKFKILVQLAADGDATNDATIRWPETRALVEFGEISLTGSVENNAKEQQHIIFDPIPRVDGIEASADPLFQPRADVYLMSGRRRRAAQPA
ncbi:MAG TPA: catalase family peroxidase [Pseudacidobacterium sp.]|jgi:catalase|nr:catalase family peroxidase [Pseudacidobacterium sp.]